MGNVLRRDHYFRRLRARAKADADLDPRLKRIMPFFAGSTFWQMTFVEFPSPPQPSVTNYPQTIAVHFHVQPNHVSEWTSWCYRALKAGDALGFRVTQELALDNGRPVSEWVISFDYILDKAENFTTRSMEAVEHLSNILRAAR